ncbi:PLAC8 motif-containing proteins Hypothetical protein [Phytophthora megakarya]|uniref:PLAC8 family protein n=1 Tax=Phytophthora megakarya TaxID=4795 RepID=A0A225WVV5_9STRA|nr:PLAC8 motif-containing proteins Hypothetical protein [Phytophthora megakarya]
MSQPLSTETPAKPAEAPYWDQADASSQPATQDAMKDLESDDGLTRGQWQVGFCDCFNTLVPNCLMVTFCSCFSVAQISARLGVTTYSKALIACLVIIIAEFVISGIASFAVSNSTTVETDYTSDGRAYTYTTSSGSGAAVIVFRGVMILVHVMFALFVMHLRMKTRERFEIPGNSRNDFFAGFCCSCCALAQIATHIKSYNPGSCEFRQVAATLPPYTK